ncbi:phosphatidate cytidylyltransferase, mitochondrial [[Candida] jaroonii]|uniref:Phosphatidate cytidylyltransferase, mitochondrial n=1 Tax=[Candida] jaroonii TaxID=467808 RepID=A0ACA9Y7U8_9ASCO|nr:phosphatidate cytidylyltransferase, mitochondrial [[Candida] jaroonii]
MMSVRVKGLRVNVRGLAFKPMLFKSLVNEGVGGLKGMGDSADVVSTGTDFSSLTRKGTSNSTSTTSSTSSIDNSNGTNASTRSTNSLASIASHFPPCISIGYGSGVFQQNGYEGETPQIDIINIVNNTRDFHRANLITNNHHYSGLKWLGLGIIERFQNFGPVSMYFNPFVNINQSMVKYGVISKDNCFKDLVEWENFYVAGRFQKPIKFINEKDQARDQAHDQSHDNIFDKEFDKELDKDLKLLQLANQYNLFSALIVSLLINRSPNITEHKIYENITSLSYLGDPRMKVGGENPNKVKNIVSKQLENFKVLYSPMMEYMVDKKYLIAKSDGFVINMSTTDKIELIRYLPRNFRDSISKNLNEMTDKKLAKVLRTALINLVARPSLIQSIKGFFTAGVVKSLKYMIAKRMKYRRR